MLETNTAPLEMLQLIKILQSSPLFHNHILAGGTALALQIGHRTSTDIDLFTYPKQNFSLIKEYVNKQFKNYNITVASDEFIQLFINKTKIELVHDDYKVVRKPVIEENIRMFDKKEIAAMKIRAVQGRSKARDFIDLAYLLQEIPLKDMFEIYKEKYGTISEKMFKRTILTKCEKIKDNEWLTDIKMLKNDIKPEDVFKCIEKGIKYYNDDMEIGKAVYDRLAAPQQNRD